MNLKERLEIILITYNRKKHLTTTMQCLLGEDSPVKDIDITLVDNCSTDGTSEYCEKLVKQYPNVKHIRNRINIGGNANICRAMEMPTKEYVWFLCDDDEYNWEYWSEVEEGLQNNADAIIVQKNEPETDLPDYILINEFGFLPSGIYKSEHITTDIIQAAYTNIYHYFPHLALGSYLLNNKKKIHVIKHKIVTPGYDPERNDLCTAYKRGIGEFRHYHIEEIDLFKCYWHSFYLLSDKNSVKKAIEHVHLGKNFPGMLYFYFSKKGINKNDILDMFLLFSFKQRVILSFMICYYLLFKNTIDFINYFADKITFIKMNMKLKRILAKNKSRKILLYGAGKFSQKLIKKNNFKNMNIVGIVDKNFNDNETDSFYGFKKISVNQMLDQSFDRLVLMVKCPAVVKKAFTNSNIHKNLNKKGVEVIDLV